MGDVRGPAEMPLVEWARAAARAADDKLGRETVVIDVGDVLSITDYFVVTSGGTTRQVRAIVDEVEEQLTILDGPKPVRIEGNDDHRWVLMDFGGFVVHVLDEESRGFYDLERLWSDCQSVPWREDADG
ncbi:MAG: ribosome silencing factor [Actinomycetota bacterium]|nr:ribosome silencing factor [Actinomycetota bacterium]MEC9467545.1 ribosome silencing factor [Actinomycetota bacterium]MED6328269.1 ribosome silencing factor [Actinomycetota bacterium]